ncbi:Zinc finger MYND domain-containing protein 11 [Nymphon striatum]|nr:Zinc finger MYND domain-containing protein 11 [Nymphon striatum]
MPLRRSSCPEVVQQLWDGISCVRQQKQIPSLNRIASYMKRKHAVEADVVTSEMKLALNDDLLVLIKKVGSKGSKQGVEQESYRLPDPKIIEKFDSHDWYCFECHCSGDVNLCSSCFRVYHKNCLNNEDESPEKNFVCKVCKMLKSKNTLKIKKDELNVLLGYAAARLKDKANDLNTIPKPEEEPWRHSLLLYHSIDFNGIESKIENNDYKRVEEFQADIQNIVHNVVIFYGVHSNMADMARQMLRDCLCDLGELRQCKDCYKISNEKREKFWFCQPCNPLHELVYAKEKWFPYWPAKVINNSNGVYDVRFFGGTHDRYPESEEFLIRDFDKLPYSDDEETLGFDEDYPSDELKTDSDDNVDNDNDSKSDSDNENPLDRLPVRPVIGHNLDSGWNKKYVGVNKHLGNITATCLPLSTLIDRAKIDKEYIKPISTNIQSLVTKRTINWNKACEELRRHQQLLENDGKPSLESSEENESEGGSSSTGSTSGSDEGSEEEASGGESDVSREESSIISSSKPHKRKKVPNNSEDYNVVSSSSQEATNTARVNCSTQTPKRVQTDKESNSPVENMPVNKLLSDFRQKIDTDQKDVKDKAVKDLSARFELEKEEAVRLAVQEMQSKLDQIKSETEEKFRETNRQEIDKLNSKQKETISETKKKQWCYNCEAEAIYHCCWNTSYCSINCQQMHWQNEHKRYCRRKR